MDKENKTSDKQQSGNDFIANVSCRFLSRETLRKIIELAAYEDSRGYVWGMDTYLGKMDELIDDAIKIVNENDN